MASRHTFEPDSAAGALLAERRRAAQASKRMAIIGILIGLGLLGILLVTLFALQGSKSAAAASTTPSPAPR